MQPSGEATTHPAVLPLQD
ncbi:hypothetical protein ACHAXS_013425 [Conticribra weissflogii]